MPTTLPTMAPNLATTKQPSLGPRESPTLAPTEQHTLAPVILRTTAPSTPTPSPFTPTAPPTVGPITNNPTTSPSEQPTIQPTLQPTAAPSLLPSMIPTMGPTFVVEESQKTGSPSVQLSLNPSRAPTDSTSGATKTSTESNSQSDVGLGLGLTLGSLTVAGVAFLLARRSERKRTEAGNSSVVGTNLSGMTSGNPEFEGYAAPHGPRRYLERSRSFIQTVWVSRQPASNFALPALKAKMPSVHPGFPAEGDSTRTSLEYNNNASLAESALTLMNPTSSEFPDAVRPERPRGKNFEDSLSFAETLFASRKAYLAQVRSYRPNRPESQ
jgi:hypothetical protein